MKRTACVIMCVVLLLGLCACSSLGDLIHGYAEVNGERVDTSGGQSGGISSGGKEPDTDAQVVIKEPDGDGFLRRFGYDVTWIGETAMGIVSCTEQDFTTLVSFPFLTEWTDGDGLYLHLKRAQNMPYVLVYRNEGVTADPQKYLEQQYLPEMRETYGDNLTEVGEITPYTAGDRSLYKVDILYYLPEYDTSVNCTRVCGEIDGSFIVFTAKKTADDNDAIYTYLEEIASYYQNGASYYYDGGAASVPTSPESGTSAAEPDPGFGEFTVTPAEPLTLETVHVSNDVFTMEAPAGWVISTHGQYTDFGIYLYDPLVPERKIFFYSKASFFNKSLAAKAAYQQMADMVTVDTAGYQLSADVPALDPPTTANFYTVYEDLVDVIYKYEGTGHIFPDLHGVQVLEQYPSSAPTTRNCLDNSIIRALFLSDGGLECEGLMGGQVTDLLTYYEGGVDLGMYVVYDVMGITAPSDEFSQLEDVLLRCLTSFDYTDSYLQQSINAAQQQTEAILAQARSMQAAYDSYNSAWSSRQTSYDIMSQKTSDSNLGYDRLYDPDTNEVYRAEVGFYDQYDLNRDRYSNSNLQLIDSSTEQYYLEPVDYYIYR